MTTDQTATEKKIEDDLHELLVDQSSEELATTREELDDALKTDPDVDSVFYNAVLKKIP